MPDKLRILNIVGARPNFMKIAPLMAEYKRHPEIEAILVHTGQHYDEKMSEQFFDQLNIPKPDINLEVGSASHAVQAAEIMRRFEPVILAHNPDLVLVVGDVNSTIACALVAAHLKVKVAHVEAGLRSYDRQMPEEINRVLTDAISDYLFVTEPSGMINLQKEGIADEKVFLVGNVMIDSLNCHLAQAEKSPILGELGLQEQGYAILTLHRPSNVDDPHVLENLLEVMDLIGNHLPLIFPVHPRTLKNIRKFSRGRQIKPIDSQAVIPREKGVWFIDPLGYLDFLKLMAYAKLVFTDSGGIQEETTILKVPCLTLRNNTERPITVEIGSNKVIGTDPQAIFASFEQIMSQDKVQCGTPDLWDGCAAERIVKILLSHDNLSRSPSPSPLA
jgi:UDP-N-acetylglucosamine 2-epimerase (non-hydrolysing)